MEDKVQKEINSLEEYNQSLTREIENAIYLYKRETFFIRWRMLSILFILIIILLIFVYVNFFNFDKYYIVNKIFSLSKTNINAFVLIIVIPGIIFFIYYYLRFSDERDRLRSDIGHLNSRINDNLNRIKRLSNSNIQVTVSPKGNLPVQVDDLNVPINELISNKQSVTIDDILLDCRESRDRLLKEVSNLKNRGVINLGIGSALTVVGIGILLFSLLTRSSDEMIKPELTMIKLVNFYLSRITTVIFVEIFSFFFLRLYRNSLSDIKYYQNEITNLEAKFLSLKSALYMNQSEVKIHVIQEILKTERNVLINAEQTSLINNLLKVDNERDRNFTDSFKSILDSLSNFVDKKDK